MNYSKKWRMDWQKFGNLKIVEGKGGEKLDGNGKIRNSIFEWTSSNGHANDA